MSGQQRFPFGAPVMECGVEPAPDQVEAYILGAYPSALHVRWIAPTGVSIAALAVDNEPQVFWDGQDAPERVKEWESERFDSAWGTVESSGNGSSGIWVSEKVLSPLQQAGTRSHFITDCLPSYRMSAGGQAAIEQRYNPFAASHPPLEPVTGIGTHPSESQIVTEALSEHRVRIAQQIAAAKPSRLVTLGDAAARVIAAMSDWSGTGKVSTAPYGQPRLVRVAQVDVTWYALIHPAARGTWQQSHRDWLDGGGFSTSLH